MLAEGASRPLPSPTDEDFVARQIGRVPRRPWRVAERCRFGLPTVIASPSRLADGEVFPTLYWLTCPYLAESVSAAESAGAARLWAQRAADDPALAESLRVVDARVREERAIESGGFDAAEAVGLAGQRDPLGVKCLHAHVAYALAGIGDPIGASLLGEFGEACADERCRALGSER